MKKYNYIASGLMILIGAYILFETSTYEVGTTAQKNPAIWPQVLALGLIVLSIVLVVQTVLNHDPEMDQEVIHWKSEGMKKVYIMFGLTAAFVVAMKLLGMLAALFLLNIAIEWIMGCRSKKMLIGFPLALVVFVYLFFGVAMKMTIPGPFWM